MRTGPRCPKPLLPGRVVMMSHQRSLSPLPLAWDRKCAHLSISDARTHIHAHITGTHRTKLIKLLEASGLALSMVLVANFRLGVGKMQTNMQTLLLH